MRKNCMITPEGTRDLLFEECLVRRMLEDKIAKTYISRGFDEVITPEIEFLDVFQFQEHNIEPELMYKMTDNRGRLIAMRPDSTMPIARLVSTRLKHQRLPLRLYYMQNIYMVSPALSGRNDQVLQSGVEIIGDASKKTDLEAVVTACDTLDACGCKQYRIEIGHIGIFQALIKKLGADAQVSEQIRRLIEIKNYPVLNDLLEQLGNGPVVEALKQLPRLFGGSEVFEKAAKVLGSGDAQIDELLGYLKSLYTDLQKHDCGDKILVDLGIVNRTDYYTGVVFRGYISGFGETAVSGGRYDSLLRDFGYQQPAVGFAINVDAVTKAVLGTGAAMKPKAPDVLVFAEKGYEIEALLHAKQLIAEGKKIENCVLDHFNDAVEYAAEKGIKHVHKVGRDVNCFETSGGTTNA